MNRSNDRLWDGDDIRELSRDEENLRWFWEFFNSYTQIIRNTLSIKNVLKKFSLSSKHFFDAIALSGDGVEDFIAYFKDLKVCESRNDAKERIRDRVVTKLGNIFFGLGIKKDTKGKGPKLHDLGPGLEKELFAEVDTQCDLFNNISPDNIDFSSINQPPETLEFLKFSVSFGKALSEEFYKDFSIRNSEKETFFAPVKLTNENQSDCNVRIREKVELEVQLSWIPSFCQFVNLPFIFFHEYSSHVHSEKMFSGKYSDAKGSFDDGWMLYAQRLYYERYITNKNYFGYREFFNNGVEKHVKRLIPGPQKVGYDIALEIFHLVIGDVEHFLGLTKQLAQLPIDHWSSDGDFHSDFLEYIFKPCVVDGGTNNFEQFKEVKDGWDKSDKNNYRDFIDKVRVIYDNIVSNETILSDHKGVYNEI